MKSIEWSSHQLRVCIYWYHLILLTHFYLPSTFSSIYNRLQTVHNSTHFHQILSHFKLQQPSQISTSMSNKSKTSGDEISLDTIFSPDTPSISSTTQHDNNYRPHRPSTQISPFDPALSTGILHAISTCRSLSYWNDYPMWVYDRISFSSLQLIWNILLYIPYFP